MNIEYRLFYNAYLNYINILLPVNVFCCVLCTDSAVYSMYYV